MTGLDAERLVSLSADGRRGSGYLLTPELVLTAGHCVGPKGSAVTARAYTRHEGSYDLSQERHTFRVAVRETRSPTTRSWNPPPPIRSGRHGTARRVRCTWAAHRRGRRHRPGTGLSEVRVEQAGARRLVNPEDVRGRVLPLTGSRREVRRLNLQIRTGSSPLARGASLWSGMSGAALFSGDHLIGVITEDRAAIEGRLIALPVSAVFGDDGPAEANACLLAALGRTAPEPRVTLDPVWAGGEILKPAYSPLPPRDQWSEADLLESRHGVVPFRGRAEQLRALVDWCEHEEDRGGGQRIRLLTGGSTVGKTRLARELCRTMAGRGGSPVSSTR